MDVEARLLLYAVALGAGVGLFTVARRRAVRLLWFHVTVLALLLAGAVIAIAEPSLQGALALPLIAVFLAFALVPSLLVSAGRRLTRSRRFAAGGWFVRTGSLLLGLPAPLRREALLYDALAASERGDPEQAAALMERLHALGGLPPGSGGGTLARVLPLAGARRWEEVMALLDVEPSGATSVLSIEARAAAETGDLRRALRACQRLSDRTEGAAALAAARRGVLAAAGRVAFLSAAVRDRLPLVRGPSGTGDVTLGRAHEARGDDDAARGAYERARARGRGAVARDADAGLARIAAGRSRRAAVDELETHALLGLEENCRAQVRRERAARGCRPTASWIVSLVTLVVSGFVEIRWGSDVLDLLAVGAVSAPLVADEGQWWRLLSTMFLHGGWVHLLMNVSAILPVGIFLERRIGSARWLVIYVGSGIVGSLASVYLNHTDVGVGASGAAMGLIGAVIVVLSRRPALFRSAERERWLRVLWICVAATAAIGLLEHRYVDNAAHGAGLVGGAILALALLPARGAALAASPGPWRRSVTRLVAALLVALTAGAGVLATRESREWHTPQVVVTEGASVRLPGWLHVRPAAEGGVVAARPPSELSVLVGAKGHAVLRPTALLPHGPLREFFLAHSRDDALDDAAHGATLIVAPAEPIDPAVAAALGDVWQGGLHFVVWRQGGAFALVLVPAGDGSEAFYGPLLDEFRRSLVATPE